MIEVPANIMTDAASSTSSMIADFGGPIGFVVGAVVLFILVPRIVSWFKLIGAKDKKKGKKDEFTYIYKDGRLAGGRRYK